MRNASKKTWTKHETEMEDEDARDFFCNHPTAYLNTCNVKLDHLQWENDPRMTLKNMLCMYSRMVIYIHLFAQMKRDHENHETE